MTREPKPSPDPKDLGPKPYETPKLERLGPVEELTQLAPTLPGVDTMIVLGTQ